MSFPFRSLLFAQHSFDYSLAFFGIQQHDEVEANREDARQDAGKNQHQPTIDRQEIPHQQGEKRSHNDRQCVLQDGRIKGCPLDIEAVRPVNRQEEQRADHREGCACPGNDVQFQRVIVCELQRHQNDDDRHD